MSEAKPSLKALLDSLVAKGYAKKNEKDEYALSAKGLEWVRRRKGIS